MEVGQSEMDFYRNTLNGMLKITVMRNTGDLWVLTQNLISVLKYCIPLQPYLLPAHSVASYIH